MKHGSQIVRAKEVIKLATVGRGKKSKWVWPGNTTIAQRKPTHDTVKNSHIYSSKINQLSLPLQGDCKTRKDTK